MASADAAILAMQSVSRSLRELSRVPARAAKAAAEELTEVVEAQEAAEVDPYDQPWKPLKQSTVDKKGGDTRILRETDRMLDSLTIAPMPGAGLSITFDPPYTAFHQIGTKDMVARQVLPRAALPTSWREAIERGTERSFDEWAEGARR
jgi:hypothetical protein